MPAHSARATVRGDGHLCRQVPRLQGLPGRRDARAQRAARSRSHRGARGRCRAARHQHVLHHQRGRGQVASVGAGARFGPTPSRCSSPDARRTCAPGSSPRSIPACDRSWGRPRTSRPRWPAISARAPTSTTTCSPASDAQQAARTRGFVKVQDGCDCHCAYCIIPTVRGSARSRPASAVLGEVRRRVAQGQPEMVMTGISVGDYRDPERRPRARAS